MTDDYTPTTEEVQFEYSMHKSVVNSRISPKGLGTPLGIHFEEFDRWLADHDAALIESLTAEHVSPESTPDQAGTTGTGNHMNGSE